METTSNGKPNPAASDERAIDIVTSSLSNEFKNALHGLLVRFVRGEDITPFERGKHYPFAFDLNEDLLKRLDNLVQENLSKLGESALGTPSFEASVRSADLSTEKFNDLATMFQKAGNKNDPERLTVSWITVLKEPIGSTARVEVQFTTEQPLETEELGLLDFAVASMDLRVAGASSQWVDATFDNLDPFFGTVKLSGIYRPLLLFRNKNIVYFASFAAAIFAQLYTQLTLSRTLNDPANRSQLNSVLSQPTFEKKFEAYVAIILQPQSPISASLLSIAISFMLFVIVLTIGYFLFPKLVPRSGISIGLATYRFAKYENAFKMIVFTFLTGGIILRLLVSLIMSIF